MIYDATVGVVVHFFWSDGGDDFSAGACCYDRPLMGADEMSHRPPTPSRWPGLVAVLAWAVLFAAVVALTVVVGTWAVS